jgi:hypothetical protein
MKCFAMVLAWCGLTATVAAQTLPSEPVALAGGRIVIGGDIAASFAPSRLADPATDASSRDNHTAFDPGFFNYSDYEHSTLRELRIGVTASVRATERFSFLGEIRSDNFERLSPFALYARVRPFPSRRFDLQIGRIPPTFGTFTRRAYSHDNPLIGYPLAYQYLTSLRPDAIPASADELLRMRGRGWLSNFSVGNTVPNRGVPLVTAFNWDTGVQASTGWRLVTLAAAITNGTASNPRVSDDNGGKQIAARVAVTPVTGLVLGSSFAHGQFLSRRVVEAIGRQDGGAFTQRVYGADVEYSRDYWVVRGDAVFSEWQLPLPRTSLQTLRALATAVEGRYSFLPAYLAVRAEHLGFSRITGSTATLPWDAPVSRIEAGGGYYLQRNLIGRLSVQYNTREGGRVTRARLVAMQLLFWF